MHPLPVSRVHVPRTHLRRDALTARAPLLALLLGTFASGCQQKSTESQEKGWFQNKSDAPTQQGEARTSGTSANAAEEPTSDLKSCSPEALARPALKPLRNMGDAMTWRVDVCVPSEGGIQGAVFKELRVTMNVLTPTTFAFLGNAYSSGPNGTGELTLPEQVVELNILGGALEFAGLQKVYVVAAPKIGVDVSKGSVCGLALRDVSLGLTGVRVNENKDVPPKVLQTAEGLFLGNHFVGNKVRGLIAKGLDAKLQELKPVMGCSKP